MKTFHLILRIFILLAPAFPAAAQLRLNAALGTKPMATQVASTYVNKAYEGPSPTYEKSTADLNRPIAQAMAHYDKTMRISYQIASANAIEWINVRSRAADILDGEFFRAFLSGQYSSLEALAYNEYVPLSAYAPMTLKLNFNFIGKTRPYYYNVEDFARIDNSAPVQTKTFLIKK
ncbi:MAG TPA: hypothetical protein VIU12_18575 [Chryseolinea sp.]